MYAKLRLEGEYQTKVFRKDGTLVYASPVKPNFITTTGLKMISQFAIADCFRYLSIGDGTAKNSLTSNYGDGTTGLDNFIPQFMYIGGRGEEVDPDHATSCYSNAGYRETSNTVMLFREWRVPSGDALFTEPYTFEEFMVSPGRPFTTGVSHEDAVNASEYYLAAETPSTDYIIKAKGVSWTNNQWIDSYVAVESAPDMQIGKIVSNTSDTLTIEEPWSTKETIVEDTVFYIKKPLRLCHCQERGTDERNTNLSVYGPEKSFVGAFYRGRNTPICAQTGAFARVLSSTSVSTDEYLTFTYALTITIDDTHKDFSLIATNSREGDNWKGTIQGKSTLLHHGLKLISPGQVAIMAPWGNKMDQQSDGSIWNADYEFGESFIPGWGCPLEPSIKSQYLAGYITTDRLQFAANQTGGAINETLGYDGVDGLMAWVPTPSKYTVETFPKNWYNIRIPNQYKDGGTWTNYNDGHNNETPNPEDYTTALSTPVNDYLPESEQHYWAQNTAAIAVIHEGVTLDWDNSRYGKVQRNIELSYTQITDNFQKSIVDKPVRGIVLAYINNGLNNGYFIPYADVQFTDKDGYLTIPKDYWDGTPEANHLDILKNDIGNTPTWHTLESDAALYFQFRETWGTAAVDCEVVDCP